MKQVQYRTKSSNLRKKKLLLSEEWRSVLVKRGFLPVDFSQQQPPANNVYGFFFASEEVKMYT